MNNLLKIIFVILIIVTIGEVGYYFYVLKGNKPSNLDNKSSTLAISPSKVDSTINNQVDKSEDDSIKEANKKELTEKILGTNAVESYLFFKDRPDQSLRIEFEQKGIVNDIQYDQVGDKRPYITLFDESNQKLITMTVSSDSKLYRYTNSGKVPINLSQIKIRNRLGIYVLSDLTLPFNSVSSIILYE